MTTPTAHAPERGFTLIEIMMTLGIMMVVVGGAMALIIESSGHQRDNFDKSDMQKSGQNALALLGTEIDNTGLGLPRALAIKSFANPGVTDTTCGAAAFPMPELEVAALDYLRQWTVSSLSATGITIASATPEGEADIAMTAGEWLFLFKNATRDGANSGQGFAQLGAARAAGANSFVVGSTAYSGVQTSLTLTNSNLSPTSEGRTTVLLRSRVSRFGVNCTDAAHPYLYWSLNGQAAIPLARNVNLSAGGLRFRFFVDNDGDGITDDQNADGAIGNADLVTAPADFANVTAIEVSLQLRSEDPNPKTGTYRTQEFVQIIGTPNINTRSTQYIFIDNNGI